MASSAKSYSAELKRKPNSHTKLPNLPIPNQINRTQQSSSTLDGKKISSKQKLQPLNHDSGMPKRNSSLQINPSPSGKIGHKTLQIQEKLLFDNKITTQPKSLLRKDGINAPISLNKVADLVQIQDKASQPNSSKGLNNSALQLVEGILHQQYYKLLIPAKLYQQRLMGRVSAEWWFITDTFILTFHKIIKIKKVTDEAKVQTESKKTGSPNKKGRGSNESPKKQQKKEKKEQSKPVQQGIVQSNIRGTIEIAKAYSHLEYENIENERHTLACFDDPNHIILILEAYFYEKSVVYLLGSIKKWFHPEEKFLIHSLAAQILPCIMECRKLILDIVFEAIENEQQDNKIRKPKYISREKKLIQISKFTSLMKLELEKCLSLLGSAHRYSTFNFSGVKEHRHLIQIEDKLRTIIFDKPKNPYLPDRISKKNYLLVIEPLNLLYRYNKKEQTLQIDPYAESFLILISAYFEIVFFTASDKEDSLLNFLGVLDKAEILAILDKHYLSYRKAKEIKNIEKIGAGFPLKNVLVVDEKVNAKYYEHCQAAVFLIDGYHAQTKLARVGGKLVRLQDYDEDQLKVLGDKLYKCAGTGGHWNDLIHDPKK